MDRSLFPYRPQQSSHPLAVLLCSSITRSASHRLEQPMLFETVATIFSPMQHSNTEVRGSQGVRTS